MSLASPKNPSPPKKESAPPQLVRWLKEHWLAWALGSSVALLGGIAAVTGYSLRDVLHGSEDRPSPPIGRNSSDTTRLISHPKDTIPHDPTPNAIIPVDSIARKDQGRNGADAQPATQTLDTKGRDEGGKEPLPSPDENKLSITCRSEQGTNPTYYTKGDTVRLYFKVNKPCYVRFLYHLADGRIVLLADDREVKPMETDRMLSITQGFHLDEPYGAERLYVFAQNQTFPPLRLKPRAYANDYDVVLDDLQLALTKTRGLKPLPEFVEAQLPIITSDREP
ncbi:MAG: hypothetical protein KA352_06885 [Flavobacteriales bacterium]|nr:hypothetical protein [Flavobacteriales bacterium]